MTHEQARDMRWMRWLFLLVIAVTIGGQFDHDLWMPDEPREAAIMAGMSCSGDYIVPHIGAQPFMEKPPLSYAVGAMFFKAFKDVLGDVASLRLMNVVFALGSLGFLYLLGRRLFGPTIGLMAAIILGTMEGFVLNAHWIRVDVSLAFFIIAAVWAFAEAYFSESWHYFILAGFLTSCAFLSKGLIGPVMIFFPWMALFVAACFRQRRHPAGWRRFLLAHAGALAFFLIPALAWMIALILRPDGKQLWQEWFWINHVGRLDGSSVQLGHMKTGEYFFYVKRLAEYALPWTPLILVGCWMSIKTLIRTRKLSLEIAFIWIWMAGCLIILTVSSTKRGLYLFPVMPAFALMAAWSLCCDAPKWMHYYSQGWIWLSVITMALMGLAPLYIGLFSSILPDPLVSTLSSFRAANWLSLALAVGVCIFSFRSVSRQNVFLALSAGTALLFIALYGVLVPALDAVQSMRKRTNDFVSQIPHHQRPRVAGWGLGETELGILYFYENWPIFPLKDPARVINILNYKDPEFTSIVINKSRIGNDLLELNGKDEVVPFQVLAQGYPRIDKAKRGLFWINGIMAPVRDEKSTGKDL